MTRRSIAALLAAFLLSSFTAPVAAAESGDETEALRDAGLGWGAIAHLQGIASAYGLSAEELLVATPVVDGERQLGLGRLIRDLDASGRAALERQARNFDQLTDAIATEAEGDDAKADAPGKADLLADALGTEASTVMALRDAGVGWGAAFKLIRFAQAMDVPVDDLLATTPMVDGEYEFGFGDLKNQLTDEQLEALNDGPRSLGHVISSAKRSDRAAEKAAATSDKSGHGRDKPKPDKGDRADKSDNGDHADDDEGDDSGELDD